MSRQLLVCLAPSRIAMTSAWAVGSCLVSRRLWASAITMPSRTSRAAIGTSPIDAAERARVKACCMKCVSRSRSEVMSSWSIRLSGWGTQESARDVSTFAEWNGSGERRDRTPGLVKSGRSNKWRPSARGVRRPAPRLRRISSCAEIHPYS